MIVTKFITHALSKWCANVNPFSCLKRQLFMRLHAKANCSMEGIEQSKTHQEKRPIIGSHDAPPFNRETIPNFQRKSILQITDSKGIYLPVDSVYFFQQPPFFSLTHAQNHHQS